MRSQRAILALAGAGVGVLGIMLGVATWGWNFLPGAAFLVVLALGLGASLRRVRAMPVDRPMRRASLGPPLEAAMQPASAPAADPLANLQALSPAQFEEFARLLLIASGLYHDVQVVGASGDQGIDLTMRDGGGNLCVVQCKRYKGTVSPSVVRELYGVMARTGAREAFLITTGRVSSAAQAWIGAKPVHVWDAERLLAYARRYLGSDLGQTIQRAQAATAERVSRGS
jgi:restriction system protein